MRRATLLGLLLAAACQSQGTSSTATVAPVSGNPGAQPSTPPHLKLTVRDPSGAAGPFTLEELEKLAIEVQDVHLGAGDHVLRLDVTGPDGTLYAQLPATLQIDQKEPGATVTLQVRGTTIESYRQIGTWQVVAVLDGTPVAASSVEVVGAAQ